MSRDNPWTKHRQSFWEMKSGSPNLPRWLRVVAYAYGMNRANGHAPLEPGDLAAVLSTVDPETGEIVVPRRDVISIAIDTAVKYEFLDPQSSARCLVVPLHAIEGGLKGKPGDPCPRPHSRSLHLKQTNGPEFASEANKVCI
jgi:hypothetical protein